MCGSPVQSIGVEQGAAGQRAPHQLFQKRVMLARDFAIGKMLVHDSVSVLSRLFHWPILILV